MLNWVSKTLWSVPSFISFIFIHPLYLSQNSIIPTVWLRRHNHTGRMDNGTASGPQLLEINICENMIFKYYKISANADFGCIVPHEKCLPRKTVPWLARLQCVNPSLSFWPCCHAECQIRSYKNEVRTYVI